MTQLGSLDLNEIVFPRLGIDVTVNSIAFSLFGVDVTWYGIFITLGMVLAMLYGFSKMRSFGLDADRAIDAVICGIIGGVIGARAYYVAFHWSEYSGNWKAIINIRSGGLAIYGGLIGALLVGAVICKLRKVRLLPMFDIAALGFLIGQGIGRWGNFTNHEAFGRNTDGLLGMSSGKIQSYLLSLNDASLTPDRPVHPCFLYESVWCLLGFLLLHLVAKKWRKFDGQIFLMYIVWYGLGRFFIEGLRTDSLWMGTVRVSQLVAAISVVVGIVLLCVMGSRVKRMRGDYVLYCNSAESQALLAEADAKEQAYEEKRAAKRNKQATNDSADPAPTIDSAEQTHTILADEATDASTAEATVETSAEATAEALDCTDNPTNATSGTDEEREDN